MLWVDNHGQCVRLLRWQHFGTASVGVKQKGMIYYTEKDVKDARFTDPDNEGDTRSREEIVPRVSPYPSYRQPHDIDFSSLGIRDNYSLKNKAWRTSSSDSQDQESSGIARLKSITGTRASNKPNAFVTPNAASVTTPSLLSLCFVLVLIKPRTWKSKLHSRRLIQN